MKNRVEYEKVVLRKMINTYCKGQKHPVPLCADCQKLLDYSFLKLDACKFGEGKSFCSACPVHCYKPEMRQTIKKVMKYSGPRMIFHAPVLTIMHLLIKSEYSKHATDK